MRLLHPLTIKDISKNMTSVEFLNATVSRKQVLSHSWSEVLKYLATRQDHPKMFLDDEMLGQYMQYLFYMNRHVGCNLNSEHIGKYPIVKMGFDSEQTYEFTQFFDDAYRFSDAVSLYFKGVNIFPHIFGDQWRKYVPIENLKEIHRVVGKTLDKKKR